MRPEIAQLVDLTIRQGPPAAVLEVGTATDGTLFLLAPAAAADGVMATIDITYSEPAVMYGEYAREPSGSR